MKRFFALALAALVLTFAGCARRQEDPYADITNPVATITMSDGGQMRFELHVAEAPNTVANFVSLANSGFYDGLEFYRVVAGVLIQGGDPNNDGTGDAGYVIEGEFAENGHENNLSHVRGTLSMCRQSDYNSASSQFFILQGTYPEYDGKYAAFGTVLDEESLSVLDAIAAQPVDGNYLPLYRQVISSIRVDTFGVEYEPVTMERTVHEEE